MITANAQTTPSVLLGSPAVGSATAVHAAIALTDAEQDITAAITDPDVPRIASVKGNAVGIAGNVVLSGTNIKGVAITDTIALNGSTQVFGVKAFATITNIHLPVETHAGTDTVSVGVGEKLGLPVTFSRDTILNAYFGGVREATRPTVVTDADEVEKNTAELSSTLDGSTVRIDYYQ